MRDDAARDLPFVKMHGLGNDFVILESRGGPVRANPALARAVGDRHRGVGFDQMAEVLDSDAADLALTFWNADGSPSGACGNATRCVAAREMDRTGRDQVAIETAGGILRAERDADGVVRVNMGAPRLDWHQVPLAREMDTLALPLPGSPVAVGMGNPHCVSFVDDVAAIDLPRVGPVLEHDPLFPERTNVEFAEVRADGTIRLRVWERGTGITLACGTGACATAVAAARRGLTGRSVRIELDGGWLSLDWRDDGIWMAGATAHVFDGVLTAAFLDSLVS
jgi:diaminopimelate epimerase